MRLPFYHSLSFRVLVGSAVLLLVLFGFYSTFTIHFYNDQLMKHVLESANRMSDVIMKSTHYSMLLNRKEDVYQIITTIGKEPRVEGIRIYNKRGEIIFSTDKHEETTTVDMHAEACYVCHDQEKPLTSLPMNNRTRIYTASEGHRILGLINPIRNESSCSNSDCHAHPADRTVLGVLDVRMSLQNIDSNIAQAQQSMLVYALITIIVITGIVVFFLLRTVIKPVKNLMRGVRQVSQGNLDHSITIYSKDELGSLAVGFNEMTHSLRHEKSENEHWAQTLEERIREKTDELKSIHSQMLQIEKMASLGKLAATVAHELNNPLEATLTYAKLIMRRIKKDETHLQPQTLEEMTIIARETNRCGTIVKNLLLFSKKQVGEFALISMKDIVEKAAQLVHHHSEISNIRMLTTFTNPELTVMCDENQIQQALIALFVNAIESMPDGGLLEIKVMGSAEDAEIMIAISDTGVGIVPEDLPHIFEPFFTTKKNGRGVGLGLSVVYGIIERHGGRISVDSKPGKGTKFTVILPKVPSRQLKGNEEKLARKEIQL